MILYFDSNQGSGTKSRRDQMTGGKGGNCLEVSAIGEKRIGKKQEYAIFDPSCIRWCIAAGGKKEGGFKLKLRGVSGGSIILGGVK